MTIPHIWDIWLLQTNTSSLSLQHLCTADMKWMMDGACLCCSPIRQTEMFCFHGLSVRCFFHCYRRQMAPQASMFTLPLSPGEDMTQEGRRQLALFLVWK